MGVISNAVCLWFSRGYISESGRGRWWCIVFWGFARLSSLFYRVSPNVRPVPHPLDCTNPRLVSGRAKCGTWIHTGQTSFNMKTRALYLRGVWNSAINLPDPSPPPAPEFKENLRVYNQRLSTQCLHQSEGHRNNSNEYIKYLDDVVDFFILRMVMGGWAHSFCHMIAEGKCFIYHWLRCRKERVNWIN